MSQKTINSLQRLTLNVLISGKFKKPSFDMYHLQGYNKFKSEYSVTNCSGTSFYINDKHDYLVRDYLKLILLSDFEARFVKIILPDRKNLVIGCIYRHPFSKLSTNDINE